MNSSSDAVHHNRGYRKWSIAGQGDVCRHKGAHSILGRMILTEPLILPTTSGCLVSKPIGLRTPLRDPLYIVSNRFGGGSTKVSFGAFCGAWRGGLLPFLVRSQDERVDGGENLPLALGCGVRPSLVGYAAPAHGVAFVTISPPISRFECRAAPPACISVRLRS